MTSKKTPPPEAGFRFFVNKVPTAPDGRLLEPELNCPVWVCADCGEPITGQDGYVLWNDELGPFVVHQNGPHCVWRFEERHGLPHLMSRELGEVMAQLANNFRDKLEIKR